VYRKKEGTKIVGGSGDVSKNTASGQLKAGVKSALILRDSISSSQSSKARLAATFFVKYWKNDG
jgi:hypothetical protein